MDRRLLLLLVAVIALVGAVNATVYAYRWITGTINIEPATAARGAACTGFYSSTDNYGGLPPAGTNANAQTYGTNTISVITGDAVCQWTVDTTTYSLYESITVTIPVTVGSWYIQDFYGFGYYGSASDPTVYVWFILEDPANDNGRLTTAKLKIYKVSGTTPPYVTEYVTEFDLLAASGNKAYITSLSANETLRLDLYLDAESAGTVEFRIDVYVSQEYETPSP